MTRTARAQAYALLLAFGLTAPAGADVFMRLGFRPGVSLEQAGGRTVYQADVRVNGQPGHLTLMGFDRPAGMLAPQLARRLGLPTPEPGAAASLHLAGRHAGRDLDLILLPGSMPEQTLALLVDRRAATGKLAGEAPAWPDDIPRPSSATPLFTAENLATRTLLAVAETPAAPQALHEEMRLSLLGAGWQEAVPRMRSDGLAIYSRGHALLLCFTQPPQHFSGPTRITLLQRRHNAP